MLFAPFHAESGRSDAVNTINNFVFTPNSTSAFENFTIVDDDVLEFDEIFIAEFSFDRVIANIWNARKVEPITAFILIKDDDCELCSDSSNLNINLQSLQHLYIYSMYLQQYSFCCKSDTMLIQVVFHLYVLLHFGFV